MVVGGTAVGAGLAADKLKADSKQNESKDPDPDSKVDPSDVHAAEITKPDESVEIPKTLEPKLDKWPVDVFFENPTDPRPKGYLYEDRASGSDDVKVASPTNPLNLKKKFLNKAKVLTHIKELTYMEKLGLLLFIRKNGKFPDKFYEYPKPPPGAHTDAPRKPAKLPKPMGGGSAPPPTESACGLTVFDTAAKTLRNAASGFLGKAASAVGTSEVPLDPETLYVTRNPGRGPILKDNPPLKVLRPTPKQMPADSMGVRTIDPKNIPPYYIARADSRPMEDILKNGFEPRGNNTSMRSHLSGGSTDSAYVSFSRSAAQAERYAFGPSSQENLPRYGYNYILKVPDVDAAVSSPYVNWYDVEEKLAQGAGSANREIAIRGKVPASWIVRIDKFERVMNRDSTWRVKHIETYDVNTFDRYWGDLAEDEINF